MARVSSHHWLRFWAIGCGTLVLALVGAALFADDGVSRHERLSEELHRLEILNRSLEKDNEKLRAEVQSLKHDSAYVERVVRDELGWVRPDELVLIVPDDEATTSKTKAEGEQKRSDR